MNPRKVTIKDIAKEAEVSETTVSRFLNQKYEYMSDNTRIKIKEVVEDLNYRPSNIARSLKSNRSKIIGAVIADIENPFSNLIIKGLNDRANELGYSLMISISNNSMEKENESIKNFVDNGVEGLIINTVLGDSDFLENINSFLPISLIDRNIESLDLDLVTSNNFELGQNLTKHLLEMGFTRIGYFTEVMKNNSVREIRHKSVQSFAQDKEIDMETFLIDREEPDKTRSDLEKFLDSTEPSVIIGANGLVQLQLMKILIENGYSLNDDFGFCGFDDWDWSTVVGGRGITTISQDSYQLGVQSIDIIHERINNRKNSTKPILKEIEGELIIRGSTQNIKTN